MKAVGITHRQLVLDAPATGGRIRGGEGFARTVVVSARLGAVVDTV